MTMLNANDELYDEYVNDDILEQIDRLPRLIQVIPFTTMSAKVIGVIPLSSLYENGSEAVNPFPSVPHFIQINRGYTISNLKIMGDMPLPIT